MVSCYGRILVFAVAERAQAVRKKPHFAAHIFCAPGCVR
jgi:hypothetical protein